MISLARPRSQHVALGLVALVSLTVLVRLPGVARPLLGNFATKNVVYAMIARNWATGAARAWYPTLDVLAGERRAWHMVEFPVSAYLTAALWRSCGGSLDVWGRLTSIAFIAAAVVAMFFLVRSWHGETAAWAAAAVLALSPVSIVYGQSFMLEASVVFFTLAAMLAADAWSARHGSPAIRTLALALCAGTFALLLLTKIYMLVLVVPLAALVLHNGSSRDASTTARVKRPLAFVIFLMALAAASVPALCWYGEAYRLAAPGNPLAERLFYSVRQSAAVHRWPHPLLATPGFYLSALRDLAGVTLAPVGFVLALVGLCNPASRRVWPWLGAMAVLAVALPLKFHEMNYYYLVVLPPLCILAGLGWQTACRRLPPGRFAALGITGGVLVVALAFSARYAVRPAFMTPREDQSVLAAARAAKELSSEHDRVATVHGSTIDLLYYCQRSGWAVPPGRRDFASILKRCQRQGATLLVVASSGDAASPHVPSQYRLMRKGDGYAIYSLASQPAIARGR